MINNFKNKKIHLVIAVAFLVLISTFLLAKQIIFDRSLSKNLTFITKDSSPSNLSNDIVSYWEGDTLVVKKTLFIAPCADGFPIILGKYEIDKSTIYLDYETYLEDPACACMCTKEVTYIIRNLPKKDYTIKIVEETLNESSEFDISENRYQGYLLPEEVAEGQTTISVKPGNKNHYLVVLKPSFNIPMPFDPELKSDFAGVLIKNEDNKRWDKFLVINENEKTTSFGNNPYYLWIENGILYLSIVDVNGAGSGEGIMKVFSSDQSRENKWELIGCYYYIPDFSYDFGQGSDGFFKETSNLDQYKKLEINDCRGDVEVVDVKD